jgi:hypothetical protein
MTADDDEYAAHLPLWDNDMATQAWFPINLVVTADAEAEETQSVRH